MLFAATVWTAAIVWWYTHLGTSSLWLVMLINMLLFLGISGRMSTIAALNSTVPSLAERGAYMSISSSLQQFAGGVSATIAGLVVIQSPSGQLDNYGTLGWLVIGAMLFTLVLMARVHRLERLPN